MLRHVEGRSYEEIASTLDLPLGTVKTYIHRARHELRRRARGAPDVTGLTVEPSPSTDSQFPSRRPETDRHRVPYAPVEAHLLDRHLRTDEIDLLLDTEVGFGVQPLRAHVRECVRCQEELERAREVLLVLEDLPHFVPSTNFADRVMLQVQVFEPWHVAARNSVLRFVPESRPARVAAGVGAAASAGILVSVAAWGIDHADMGLLMAAVGLDQAQASASAALSDVTLAVVGQSGLDAWASGGPMVLALAGAGFVVAAGAMVMGLRRLTAAKDRS